MEKSMMNEANTTAVCGTQTVNAPLCEARQCSAQSAMGQAKKQTLKQPMEQAIKQPAREFLHWCHKTALDQRSKASGSQHQLWLRVRNSFFCGSAAVVAF
jgi:hypothetical protein